MEFDFSMLNDEEFSKAIEAVWRESLKRFEETVLAAGEVMRSKQEDADDE